MTAAVRRLACLVALVALAACSPAHGPAPGDRTRTPEVTGNHIVMGDGARLPVYRWMPRHRDPKAVIVGVHGFNDHGMAFDTPGAWFAAHGIGVYAYDQRGFGGAPHPGRWPGTGALVRDLAGVVERVRARHPDTPVYVLGSSMGGAVAVAAAARDRLPDVAGTILAAPAVWARRTMPVHQRWGLWLAAHTVPWLTVSGADLGIRASDNTVALRTLAADPRVMAETRVAAMHGLTNLMDTALDAAPDAPTPLLALYGQRDGIVPPDPMRRFWTDLPDAGVTRALYRDGWHLLLRDRRADRVWRDIAAWIAAPKEPLPSRADERARRALSRGDLRPAETGAGRPARP